MTFCSDVLSVHMSEWEKRKVKTKRFHLILECVLDFWGKISLAACRLDLAEWASGIRYWQYMMLMPEKSFPGVVLNVHPAWSIVSIASPVCKPGLTFSSIQTHVSSDHVPSCIQILHRQKVSSRYQSCVLDLTRTILEPASVCPCHRQCSAREWDKPVKTSKSSQTMS